MNELALNNQREIQELLDKDGLDIAVGDVAISNSDYSPVIRITGLEVNINQYRKESDEDYKRLIILCETATDWDCTEWEKHSSYSPHDFKYYGYQKLDRPLDEYLADSMRVIKGEISMQELSVQEHEQVNENSSLIGRTTKVGLMAMKADMEKRKNRVEIIKKFVGMEMNKRKAELEKIREGLNQTLAVFQKQIQKIMRVIVTIELYLGVDGYTWFKLVKEDAAKAEE